MSRRSIPARLPGLTIVAGWDNPLGTFFAQVTRDQDGAADDPVILWIGGLQHEVQRAEDLAAHLAPYADLSTSDIEQLRADRAAAADRGPSKLQRDMLGRVGQTR